MNKKIFPCPNEASSKLTSPTSLPALLSPPSDPNPNPNPNPNQLCISKGFTFPLFLIPSLSSTKMRRNRIRSFFSKLSNLQKKRSRSESSSFGSATASSSSDETITPKSVLRESEGDAVADLFSVFDRDGDGRITKRELEAVLRRLGPHDPPTEEELDSIVAEIDRDGDGCISLDELGTIGAAALGPPADARELRDVFAAFDADGDGKISAEELLGVFVALGDGGCTIDDCRRMIVGVDTDGDGFVCFRDFSRMMDGQRCSRIE